MTSDLHRIVDRVKSAKDAFAAASADFRRFRNNVDSAGELALVERFPSTQRPSADVIGELDVLVATVGQRDDRAGRLEA